MTALSNAVRNALGRPDADAAADAIKEAACDLLATFDPAAKVRKTSHFNHSFMPDVVLQWDGGSDQTRTRLVFLRFDVTKPWLAQDVRDLGGADALILGLDDNPSDSAPAEQILSELERQPRTMVAEPDAMESLLHNRSDDLVSRSLRQAIMPGGRGFYDGAAAERIQAAGVAAYSGALNLDNAITRQALATVRNYLTTDYAEPAAKTLNLLWWASGGTPSEFPGGNDLALDVGESDFQGFLQHLFVNERTVEDRTFWRRIARRVKFETLAGLFAIGSSANLQHLFGELLTSLDVSCVAADRTYPRLAPFEPAWWEIVGGRPTLNTRDFQLVFDIDARHFSGRADAGLPISVAEAAQRTAGYVVTEVGVEESDVRITVESVSSQEEPHEFEELVRSLQTTGSVREVTVELPGGRRFRTNFTRMLGIIDDGTSNISAVAEAAIDLLIGSSIDESQEVYAYLRPVPTQTPTPNGLFDGS